jgi:hypothetical protein
MLMEYVIGMVRVWMAKAHTVELAEILHANKYINETTRER